MRIGVNYTPSHGWFHSWLDFDPDAVRRDFEVIAALGLDHVRIFPLWTLLQPNRGLIRPQAIADVVSMVRLAHEFGLETSVDAINGHLSSFEFLPPWVVTWHRKNLFTDETTISGERALVAALAEALRGEPGVTGMTLGNELPQFAASTPGQSHPQPSPATPEQVDAWLDAVMGAVETAWPEGGHWFGFDDGLWFSDTQPFTPRHAVTRGTATTVHSWVFGQVGPRFGAHHPALTWFPRYLLELARAWDPAKDRTLWLQEVGAPRTHVADADAPAFVAGTLDAIRDTPGLEAVTWWCSHDVSRDLYDFPELEYSLGLFANDGTPKPEARQLAEMIPDLRAVSTPVDRPDAPPSTPPDRPEPPAATLEFSADWRTGAGRSVCAPRDALFARWVDEAVRTGRPPELVRVGD